MGKTTEIPIWCARNYLAGEERAGCLSLIIFIKLQVVIKTFDFVCLKWPLYTGFTVHHKLIRHCFDVM